MTTQAKQAGAVHWPQAALAALVMGIVGMMVVPLPTAVLDLLIGMNLALSVVVLAASLYLRDGLGFAAFPSLLLLTTLYRLALNVSSTRLILLQADAGRVIDAFGHFVVRGDYLVGAVVFVVLTIIQFAVIARGAERVAEVGARFTLDALPGKQLALDAEQRSGQLSRPAAQRMRKRLDRESQFYGAMDGAMKFVKGDAIAGIVITAINLLAGVGIGTFAREQPFESAVRTYGLLTIGDGLVSQLPALLISTAAGLVVTRVASERGAEGSLGGDLAQQLAAQPRALWVAAAVCLGLAWAPGFPAWAFVLLAALLALGAWRGEAAQVRAAAAAVEGTPAVTLDEVQRRLDALADSHPTLLAHCVPTPYPVTRLTHVLRALVAEGISLHDLPVVLEVLAQQPARCPDHALVEHVRRGLGPRLTAAWIQQGRLQALRLSPTAEEALLDARVEDEQDCWLAIEPDLAKELTDDVLAAQNDRRLPLLVRPALRGPLYRLLHPHCPELTVLSVAELPAQVRVENLAWVGPR